MMNQSRPINAATVTNRSLPSNFLSLGKDVLYRLVVTLLNDWFSVMSMTISHEIFVIDIGFLRYPFSVVFWVPIANSRVI